MKQNTLLQHIGLAIALSVLALINDLILRQFFNVMLSNQLNISLLACLYLGFIIRQSPLISGRITLFAINLSIVLISLFWVNHTSTLLVIYLAMIFCNRALLCYSNLLAIMADLGLCSLSTSAVFLLLANSYSNLTALWCFMLLQALHTLLPNKKVAHAKRQPAPSQDKFNHALQSAEGALQKLLS